MIVTGWLVGGLCESKIIAGSGELDKPAEHS